MSEEVGPVQMEEIGDDVNLSSEGELESLNLGATEEMNSEAALESPRFKSNENEGNARDNNSESSADADPTTEAYVEEVNTKKEVIETLKQLRKSKTPEQEIVAAGKLARLSSSSDTKPELQKNISLFVDMLKEGPVDVQKSILQIFQAIGTTSEAKRNIRKNGGVKELVRCISLGGELRHQALNVLGFVISKDEENAEEFVEEGGVAGLRDSLDDEDKRIRFLAAACSWVLASYIRFQTPLVDCNFVQKCLEMVDDNEDIAWQAMGTLRNLVIKNEDVHKVILDCDGLNTLKKALSEGSSVSLRAQQLIIQTLFVVTSTNVVFKNSFRENDLFTPLLHKLENSKNEDLLVKILQLLVNLLAKNTENQDFFREQGGLDALFKILMANESEVVCGSTATTLWAATINNLESVDSLTDENIDFIAQSLILSAQPILVGLVATISNIANSSERGQNLIRERKMIPLIIDFLRGSHAPLLEATGGAIMAICKGNEENSLQILEWDGALLLSRNLSSPNNGVKQNVAGALRLLLELNFVKTMKAIREVEGVLSLLQMLKAKTRPQLQSNAAHCLLLLVERSQMIRERVVALNGQFAISASLDSENETLQAIMCDVVCALAKNSEDFRVALGKEDVVSKVIGFVEECSPVVINPALRALWALCLNNDPHQQMARASEVIDLLVDQLTTHSTTIETKAFMLRAIASICDKNQEIFRLNEKGIHVLVGNLLLCNSDDETNQQLGEATSIAMWCLSTGNSRMQTTMREKHGLIPLVEMVHGNPENPLIMLNAMGSLTELCRRCSTNKKIVKEAGIVDWLGPIESHDNETVSAQAKELRSILG